MNRDPLAVLPFPLYALMFWVRKQAAEIPGPWPVRIVIFVVLLLMPGWIDEFLFFGGLKLYRKIRAHYT
jgi:hypothetical protein